MLRLLVPDRFILTLLALIALATAFPAKGYELAILGHVANTAIFSLFFFHGLRLGYEAVWNGLKHWRLQLAILLTSFAVLPLLGLSLSIVFGGQLSPELWFGIFFLCALPSTVQAAIASSSMAGGNVAASVIASALSNLLAVFITPLLVAALVPNSQVAIDQSIIMRIATLLLLPFILGQCAQLWLKGWIDRNRGWVGQLDRLTICLTIYAAFSAAANDGIWSRLSIAQGGFLLLIILILLAASFGAALMIGGAGGFARADRISLLFAGAHKSLATGAPMARILFSGPQAGFAILPLMIYHQAQLIISAWIATRLASPDAEAHRLEP